MSRYLLLPAVLLALLAHGTAWAQVEPTQPGNLLDSNFQIGSGGYNRVPGGVGGVNSQMYVTGQVTGLRAFRGPVGYTAENELRLALPSAGLTEFRRQSVGAPDAVLGESYLSSPYYERTQTIVGLPGISRGMNIPGSNVPAQLRPLEPLDPYNDNRFRLLEAPPLPRAPAVMGAPVGGTLPGLVPQGPGLVPQGDEPLAIPRVNRRPGDVDFFSNLSDSQRLELSRELLELRRRQEKEQQEPPREGDSQQVQARVDTRVASQVEQGVTQQVGPRTDSPAPPGTLTEQEQQRQLDQQQSPPQGDQVPANQDVFYDMLRQLRLQESGQARPPAGQEPTDAAPGRWSRMDQPPEITAPRGDGSPQPGDELTPPLRRFDRLTPELPGQTQVQEALRPSPQSRAPQQELPAWPDVQGKATDAQAKTPSEPQAEALPLVEPLADQGLILRGLAGQGPDLVNRHMQQAQEYLQKGQFYEAADEFDMAAALDAKNPLPQLGAGLSLFAAGEALSAGLRIRKSMDLFPPLMQSRVDVVRVIADLELIQDRLLVVQDRLERADDEIKPMLLFVATFMYHNLGQSGPAEHFAQQLRTMTAHPVYAQYAAVVLAAPGAKTQPAAGTELLPAAPETPR